MPRRLRSESGRRAAPTARTSIAARIGAGGSPDRFESGAARRRCGPARRPAPARFSACRSRPWPAAETGNASAPVCGTPKSAPAELCSRTAAMFRRPRPGKPAAERSSHRNCRPPRPRLRSPAGLPACARAPGSFALRVSGKNRWCPRRSRRSAAVHRGRGWIRSGTPRPPVRIRSSPPRSRRTARQLPDALAHTRRQRPTPLRQSAPDGRKRRSSTAFRTDAPLVAGHPG